MSAGLGHNYRRAVEHGIPNRLELEEHSNFSVGLGLLAAAMGVPFLPTRTLLGSDLVARNPRLRPAEPGLLHVLAIEPDVAILHVQRADAEGHAHCWGNLGITREAGLAGRGANGVGASRARLVILGSGTVPVSTSFRFPPSQPCRSRLRSSLLQRLSRMPVRPYRTGRRPRLQTGKYRRRPLGKT